MLFIYLKQTKILISRDERLATCWSNSRGHWGFVAEKLRGSWCSFKSSLHQSHSPWLAVGLIREGGGASPPAPDSLLQVQGSKGSASSSVSVVSMQLLLSSCRVRNTWLKPCQVQVAWPQMIHNAKKCSFTKFNADESEDNGSWEVAHPWRLWDQKYPPSSAGEVLGPAERVSTVLRPIPH